jgi:hypothetical protein
VKGLGTRELVAVVGLGAALVIGFLFFNPANSESSNDHPGAISLGQAAPTSPPASVPAPTATPTSVPRDVTLAAGGWALSFFEIRSTGSEILSASGFVPALDLAYATAPFTDFADNSWKVSAAISVQVTGGTSAFTIEHDGEAAVFVDGREVAREADGSAPQTLRVTFEHAAGQAAIRIEGRDASGPFRLRWVN